MVGKQGVAVGEAAGGAEVAAAVAATALRLVLVRVLEVVVGARSVDGGADRGGGRRRGAGHGPRGIGHVPADGHGPSHRRQEGQLARVRAAVFGVLLGRSRGVAHTGQSIGKVRRFA